MERVKLKDIAEELNISITTVSRALTGKNRVSPQTRQRVLDMVKELNYAPNAVARSLRLRNSKTIGALVPDISNVFYASVIKGMQQVCREHGYTVIVCNSDGSEALEDEAQQMLLEKQVAGLVLATVSASNEMAPRFRQESIPVVYIDNIPTGLRKFDSVSINNFNAAYTLTKAVIARGYSKIGSITGPISQSTGQLRYLGFIQAMEENEIYCNPDWIIEGDFKIPSGKKLMDRILEQENKPDAMVVANNYMAYGAMDSIRKHGLQVPQDLAVVAFDALDETGLITPCISSINQPAVEIGIRSAEIIIDKLSGGESAEKYQNIVLVPELQEGNSW